MRLNVRLARALPPHKTSGGEERRAPVDQGAPETGIAAEGSSIAGRDGALAATIQPVVFRGSPRLATDLCPSVDLCTSKERVMLFANCDLPHTPSSRVGRTSTQMNAHLRT